MKLLFIVLMLFISVISFSTELQLSLNESIAADPISYSLLSEVANEISKRTNIKISFVLLPGERALFQADTGATDGDFGRAEEIVLKYKNLIKVSEPLLTTKYIAISKGNKGFIPTWENLKDYKVITSRGSKLPEFYLKGKMKKGKFDTPPGNIEKLCRMVLLGRADFAITPDSDFNLLINKIDPQKELYIYSPPLITFDSYILLNKSKSEYAIPIANALIAMKKDNTLHTLIKNSINSSKSNKQ